MNTFQIVIRFTILALACSGCQQVTTLESQDQKRVSVGMSCEQYAQQILAECGTPSSDPEIMSSLSYTYGTAPNIYVFTYNFREVDGVCDAEQIHGNTAQNLDHEIVSFTGIQCPAKGALIL